MLLLVLGMAGIGIYSYQKLPIDAVPDITNVQVQINTGVPGYSPLEAEQRITSPSKRRWPVCQSATNPFALALWAIAGNGDLQDGTDIYFARQLVNERIQEAGVNCHPVLSQTWGRFPPVWEIYMDGGGSAGCAQRLTARLTAPPICAKSRTGSSSRSCAPCPASPKSTPSAATAVQIAPDPQRLMAHGLALQDLLLALERNNANVGAGYIEKAASNIWCGHRASHVDQRYRRHPAQPRRRVPIRIRDVAEVSIGKELRTGAATEKWP